MLREKKYTEALDLLDKQSTPLSVFLRVHIHQQMKNPVLAVDTLLSDVLTWKPAHVPEAYVQMLIKASQNLNHCDKVDSLIEMTKEKLSAQTYFAYIEMLQYFKLNDKVPEVVQLLIDKEPDNK